MGPVKDERQELVQKTLVQVADPGNLCVLFQGQVSVDEYWELVASPKKPEYAGAAPSCCVLLITVQKPICWVLVNLERYIWEKLDQHQLL